MKTIHILCDGIPTCLPSTAAIGYFDGVHKGHRELLKTVMKTSADDGTIPAVITFEPSPHQFFSPDDTLILTDAETKMAYFEELGIHTVYVFAFDQKTAQTSPDEFISTLNKMNISTLVCGFDFTFGYKGQGTSEYLQNSIIREFDVTTVKSVDYYGRKISATRIIHEIRAGNIRKAEKMLGHEMLFTGMISGGVFMHKDIVVPEKGSYTALIDGIQYPCYSDKGMLKIDHPDTDHIQFRLFNKT